MKAETKPLKKSAMKPEKRVPDRAGLRPHVQPSPQASATSLSKKADGKSDEWFVPFAIINFPSARLTKPGD